MSKTKKRVGIFFRAAITGKDKDIQVAQNVGIDMTPNTDGGYYVKDEDLQRCRDLGIDVVTVGEDRK